MKREKPPLRKFVSKVDGKTYTLAAVGMDTKNPYGLRDEDGKYIWLTKEEFDENMEPVVDDGKKPA